MLTLFYIKKNPMMLPNLEMNSGNMIRSNMMNLQYGTGNIVPQGGYPFPHGFPNQSSLMNLMGSNEQGNLPLHFIGNPMNPNLNPESTKN